MTFTGVLLVLGPRCQEPANYLDAQRLDFEHLPLDTPFQKDTKCLLVFLCGNKDEDLVIEKAEQLDRLQIPTVVLGQEDDARLERHCESKHHVCYVASPASHADIEHALTTVLYGSRASKYRVEMQDYASRLDRLTTRQRLILLMAAEGFTNRRIGRIVGLAEKSVERERRNAREKLDVSNAAEMMRVVALGVMFAKSNLGSAA